MTRRPSFELDEPDEKADVELQTDRAYLRSIATRTAASHGIQSREPGPLRKRTGPKPGRTQGRMTMTGPVEVFERFKIYTADRDMSYWQALEFWMAQDES